MWNAALLTLGVAALLSERREAPVAYPPQGPVRGLLRESPAGDVITQFLGIPYAAPPVGALRFGDPQPHASWSLVRDVTEYGHSCLQDPAPMREVFPPEVYDTYVGNLTYSEDCLTLNVFYPGDFARRDRNRKLPVIVFIHGGGFILGQASFRLFEGDVIATHGDVIVVTLQYRLGVFGFLTTNDDAAPGNAGLLDQRLAMIWVKDNIRAFGGDPDKVTLMGESAGAVSVSLHMLSPGSRGLFQQAVSLSGAVSRHILQEQVELASYTYDLLQALNCTRTYTDESVSCLREVPANELHARVVALGMHGLFTPSVDGRFLPRPPGELLSRGDVAPVPSMWGTVPFESPFYFVPVAEDFMDEGIDSNDAVKFLSVLSDLFPAGAPLVLAQLMGAYFGDGFEDSIMNLHSAGQMLTDGTVEAPKARLMEALSDRGQHVYEFSFIHRFSFLPSHTYSPGAQHGDLIYAGLGSLLEGGVLHGRASPAEENLSRSLIHAITSFAWTGEPMFLDTPGEESPFPVYENKDRRYLTFTMNMTPKKVIGEDFRGREKRMWNFLLPALRMPDGKQPVQGAPDEAVIVGSQVLGISQ